MATQLMRSELKVDMEGLSVLNRQRFRRVLWERRVMFASAILCILNILLFLIAIITTHWAVFEVKDETANCTVTLHVGIWGEWRTELHPDTRQLKGEPIWIKHFPEPPTEFRRLTGANLLHYLRTQAVFSVVAISLMALGVTFAFYSFKHHRYMYKRLTFGLLALVAMCVLVVIEVLINSANEWKSFAKDRDHHQDFYFKKMSYGYSIYLAWVVFGCYTLAAFVFLVGGRKQKGDNAATREFEEEDRPVNLS